MSLTLDVYYDFSRKELRIKFDDPQHAQQYQALNREGRIHGDDEKSIWIPIPPEVRQLRASTYGFILCFTSASAASSWCRRVALGQLYGYNDGMEEKEAYIIREWDKAELERILRRTGQRLAPPQHGGAARNGPSPAREEKRKRDVGFGVRQQYNSRSSP